MNDKGFQQLKGYLPFAIGAAALFALNGTSWWAYLRSSAGIRENFRIQTRATAQLLAEQVEAQYAQELERRLSAMEEAPLPAELVPSATEGLSPRTIVPLVPEPQDWLIDNAAAILQNLAPSRVGNAVFHDLYLMRSNGEILATWSDDPSFASGKEGPSTNEWSLHPLLREDEPFIREALEERAPVSTREVYEEGFVFLSAYAPIAFSGMAAGLLGVRANFLLGERLLEIERGLILGAVIGSVLVILLSVMSFRIWKGLEEAERRTRDAERLAQLGQMVSVVAHEIRNPLGIIEQTADLIRRRYAKEKDDELLHYISEEVGRLNGIVNRFLAFAKPEKERQQQEALSCRPAKEIEKVHRQTLSLAQQKGIRFETDIEDPKIAVRGLDSEACRQILLNLVYNAFDATPTGGTVSVSLRKSGSRVALELRDTGEGMSLEQREKATEPFYTTKERGSGLGLALVAKLVGQAGGDLSIESKEGVGSGIVIHLKCAS